MFLFCAELSVAFSDVRNIKPCVILEYHEDKIAKIEYQSDQAISSAKNEKRKLKAQILTQKVQVNNHSNFILIFFL